MTTAAIRRPLPPVPFNERERLTALFDTCLLDTEPDPAFDEIIAFAMAVMQTPIAVVSLVDQHRQWFKAKSGIDFGETPREDAFCAYAILQREPLIVKDARTDARFCDHPMVTGETGVRFYFGIPIRSGDGMPLGALAVVDTAPRDQVSNVAMAAMQFLARRVEQLIRAHRSAGYRDRATGLANQRRFRENAVVLYRSTVQEANHGWAVSIEAVSASQSRAWIEANQADRIDARMRQVGRWVAAATSAREGVYRLSARHLGFFVESAAAPAIQSMLSRLARGLATFVPDAKHVAVLDVDADVDVDVDIYGHAHLSVDEAVGSGATSPHLALRALRLNAFDDEAALVAAMIGPTTRLQVQALNRAPADGDAIRKATSEAFVAASAITVVSAMRRGSAVDVDADANANASDAAAGVAGGILYWRMRRNLSSYSWSGADVRWTRTADGVDDRRADSATLSDQHRIVIAEQIAGLLERFARACAKFGRRDARIQIDVSADFFFGPEPLQLMDAASAFGVKPEQVEWALPVTVLCNTYAQAQARVLMLRKLGAGVVITGIGAGFDTLSWLPSLPFTGICFDARLTDAVSRDSGHSDVVRRLSSLVHALGARVSAEGLDTPEAVAVARFLAVHEGTGDAIARTLKTRRLPANGPATSAAPAVSAEVVPQTSTNLSAGRVTQTDTCRESAHASNGGASSPPETATPEADDAAPTRRKQSLFDAVCRPLTFLSSRFSSLP